MNRIAHPVMQKIAYLLKRPIEPIRHWRRLSPLLSRREPIAPLVPIRAQQHSRAFQDSRCAQK